MPVLGPSEFSRSSWARMVARRLTRSTAGVTRSCRGSAARHAVCIYLLKAYVIIVLLSTDKSAIIIREFSISNSPYLAPAIRTRR